MAKLLDANLIIRYFTNDDKEKAREAEKLFRSGEELWLNDVAISEVIWLLTSYYKFPKNKIIPKIEALLSLKNVKANKNTLSRALSYYQKYSIDWIDAYLASFATENQLVISSYDKDFDKIRGIKRKEL